PLRLLSEPISFDRTESFRKTLINIAAAVPSDNAATARNQVHQSFERRLHCVEVFIDVRVIEFDRGKDHRIRKVVQKLRPFVPERGIVLVAFDDEVFAIADTKAALEILRDATNQK